MAKRDSIMKRQIFLILGFTIVFSMFAFPQTKKTTKASGSTSGKKDTAAIAARHRIMFVELGSVNCIPCRAMQPVMKSVEEKYGGHVKVIFYDVRTEEQAHYGQEFNIRLIPTQVFLDRSGKELMRHEGYFPEKEIDAFLQSKGLKAKSPVKG
jgi:thioredoxin 1